MELHIFNKLKLVAFLIFCSKPSLSSAGFDANLERWTDHQRQDLPKDYQIVRPLQLKNEDSTDPEEFVNTKMTNTSGHLSKFSFSFQFNEKTYKLRLSLNEGLLPANFATTTFDENNIESVHKPTFEELDHCYYHGEVIGENDSFVMMSTCNGLRGCILLNDDALLIEPLHQGAQEQANNLHHVVYRVADMLQPSGSCGNKDESHELLKFVNGLRELKLEKNKHSKRLKRSASSEKKFVELLIVADNAATKEHDRVLLDSKLKEVANYLDGFYRQLGIRIVLSHIEAWTKTDKIPLKTNAKEVLNEFLKYRQTRAKSDLQAGLKSSPWAYADNAQLVYGGSFDGSTIGMASVGSMCGSRSGGVNQYHKTSTLYTASTIAHEMGHNFGMNHDTSDCSCPPNSDCIMAASSGFSSSKKWSSCSELYLEQNLKLGIGNCLLNVPPKDRIYGGPKCGNDIVEEGEECDCGLPEDCTSSCCNATSCQLLPDAECDAGICCASCKFTERGTKCRDTAGNNCDLPEFCTGFSPSCPGNVYKENGIPCLNGGAYCYEGVCLTRDTQCENIWSSGATSGIDSCYTLVNRLGNWNGNCGKFKNGTFIKCTISNSLCGKLHCTGGKRYPVVGRDRIAFRNRIAVDGTQFECKTISSDENATDVSDPGLVRDGTFCGVGKVCNSGHCVSVGPMTCADTCNGRGLCNNLGHCHCDPGWAPPYCDVEGNGGSVVSGPISSNKVDTSVVLMLVMFLVVLPLMLGVGTWVWCKYFGGKNYIESLRENRRRRLEAVRRNKKYKTDAVPTSRPKISADVRHSAENLTDHEYSQMNSHQAYPVENITVMPVHSYRPVNAPPSRPPPPPPQTSTKPVQGITNSGSAFKPPFPPIPPPVMSQERVPPNRSAPPPPQKPKPGSKPVVPPVAKKPLPSSTFVPPPRPSYQSSVENYSNMNEEHDASNLSVLERANLFSQ